MLYNIGTGYLAENLSGQPFKIGGSVHINYLALDEHFHHHSDDYVSVDENSYMSDFLMQNCLRRIADLRASVGFAFITLTSTKKGRSLYERHDFDLLDEEMWFNSEENKSSMFEDDENDPHSFDMYRPVELDEV